MYNFLLNVI